MCTAFCMVQGTLVADVHTAIHVNMHAVEVSSFLVQIVQLFIGISPNRTICMHGVHSIVLFT